MEIENDFFSNLILMSPKHKLCAPQSCENERTYYNNVYQADVTHKQTIIDATGKKGRKWFWEY